MKIKKPIAKFTVEINKPLEPDGLEEILEGLGTEAGRWRRLRRW